MMDASRHDQVVFSGKNTRVLSGARRKAFGGNLCRSLAMRCRKALCVDAFDKHGEILYETLESSTVSCQVTVVFV